MCPSDGCGNPSPIPQPPTIPPFPTTGVVAIVMSPGAILSGNDRRDGVDTNPNPALNSDPAKKPVNFLDAAIGLSNATGSSNGNDFIAAMRGSSFNDKLLGVLDSDVFSAVNNRMENVATLAEIANCISEYGKQNAFFGAGDRRLPWPTELSIADPSDKNQYDDSPIRLSGHVPYRISDSTLAPPAHNWSTIAIQPSKRNTMAACFTWPTWWDSWKAFVFFAIGDNFKPSSSPLTVSCTANPSGCLSVNGGVRQYAAILIFAGRPLLGQVRSTVADKQNASNYLEDENRSGIQGNTGGGNFTKGTISTGFNDVVVCIKEDLTVDTNCS